MPQGTLAEKIISGGAGIGAFYTRTGVNTVVEKGGIPIKYAKGGKTVEIASTPKPVYIYSIVQVEILRGQKFIREDAILGDYAIIKAHTADTYGNLQFVGTSRNFNEDMVKAGKITIAEVEQIVPFGTFGLDQAHVNGIYVDYLYLGKNYKKQIERLVYNQTVYDAEPEKYSKPKSSPNREIIAKRAA